MARRACLIPSDEEDEDGNLNETGSVADKNSDDFECEVTQIGEVIYLPKNTSDFHSEEEEPTNPLQYVSQNRITPQKLNRVLTVVLDRVDRKSNLIDIKPDITRIQPKIEENDQKPNIQEIDIKPNIDEIDVKLNIKAVNLKPNISENKNSRLDVNDKPTNTEANDKPTNNEANDKPTNTEANKNGAVPNTPVYSDPNGDKTIQPTVKRITNSGKTGCIAPKAEALMPPKKKSSNAEIINSNRRAKYARQATPICDAIMKEYSRRQKLLKSRGETGPPDLSDLPIQEILKKAKEGKLDAASTDASKIFKASAGNKTNSVEPNTSKESASAEKTADNERNKDQTPQNPIINKSVESATPVPKDSPLDSEKDPLSIQLKEEVLEIVDVKPNVGSEDITSTMESPEVTSPLPQLANQVRKHPRNRKRGRRNLSHNTDSDTSDDSDPSFVLPEKNTRPRRATRQYFPSESETNLVTSLPSTTEELVSKTGSSSLESSPVPCTIPNVTSENETSNDTCSNTQANIDSSENNSAQQVGTRKRGRAPGKNNTNSNNDTTSKPQNDNNVCGDDSSAALSDKREMRENTEQVRKRGRPSLGKKNQFSNSTKDQATSKLGRNKQVRLDDESAVSTKSANVITPENNSIHQRRGRKRKTISHPEDENNGEDSDPTFIPSQKTNLSARKTRAARRSVTSDLKSGVNVASNKNKKPQKPSTSKANCSDMNEEKLEENPVSPKNERTITPQPAALDVATRLRSIAEKIADVLSKEASPNINDEAKNLLLTTQELLKLQLLSNSPSPPNIEQTSNKPATLTNTDAAENVTNLNFIELNSIKSEYISQDSLNTLNVGNHRKLTQAHEALKKHLGNVLIKDAAKTIPPSRHENFTTYFLPNSLANVYGSQNKNEAGPRIDSVISGCQLFDFGGSPNTQEKRTFAKDYITSHKEVFIDNIMHSVIPSLSDILMLCLEEWDRNVEMAKRIEGFSEELKNTELLRLKHNFSKTLSSHGDRFMPVFIIVLNRIMKTKTRKPLIITLLIYLVQSLSMKTLKYKNQIHNVRRVMYSVLSSKMSSDPNHPVLQVFKATKEEFDKGLRPLIQLLKYFQAQNVLPATFGFVSDNDFCQFQSIDPSPFPTPSITVQRQNDFPCADDKFHNDQAQRDEIVFREQHQHINHVFSDNIANVLKDSEEDVNRTIYTSDFVPSQDQNQIIAQMFETNHPGLDTLFDSYMRSTKEEPLQVKSEPLDFEENFDTVVRDPSAVISLSSNTSVSNAAFLQSDILKVKQEPEEQDLSDLPNVLFASQDRSS